MNGNSTDSAMKGNNAVIVMNGNSTASAMNAPLEKYIIH
jgi:hypothetical protein